MDMMHETSIFFGKMAKVIIPYQHHAQETIYLKQPSRWTTDPNLPGFLLAIWLSPIDV